jgi:hypothetical protein
MSVKTAPVVLPELSGPNIRLSPTEAIRAAMDLHDPTIKVISLRGHDYYPFSNKANCRTVQQPTLRVHPDQSLFKTSQT